MVKKNRKTLVFIQDNKHSAYPILSYLLDEKSEILSNVELIVVESRCPWNGDYSSIRKRLKALDIEFDFESYVSNQVISKHIINQLTIPLSEELAINVMAEWCLEFKTAPYNENEYWRPVNASNRILASYFPGQNGSLKTLFSSPSDLMKNISNIIGLELGSKYIDCGKIKKLVESRLLFDRSKDFLNKLIESLDTEEVVVRSNNPSFQPRFYVTSDAFYLEDNLSNRRLITELIPDIKQYSLSHPYENLFIQKIYRGTEFVVNGYIDDVGKHHFSIFKFETDSSNQTYLTPVNTEFKLIPILEQIQDICLLKLFSAKFIKLSDDKYALITLHHSFNDYLGATLKYHMDPISYELTRGLMSDSERNSLLFGKYSKDYTDQKIKANLIY